MSSYLHGNRKVSLSLGREVDINSFLGEGLAALGWSANLNDVKLEVEEEKSQKSIILNQQYFEFSVP